MTGALQHSRMFPSGISIASSDMFPDARGHAGGVQIITSLDAAGRPLSDHDLITCCIEGLHQALKTDEDKKDRACHRSGLDMRLA